MLDPDPSPFYDWLSYFYNGNFEYMSKNGEFTLYLDSDWLLDDPNIHVIDDTEWPDDPDPEWEAAEAEYEPIFEDGELTVILTDNAGNGFEVFEANDEEGEGEDA